MTNQLVRVNRVVGKPIDPDAFHRNVNGEIASLTEKITPVNTDVIIIEDSEDGNSVKKLLVANIPGATPGLVQTDFVELTVDDATTSTTFVTLLTSNITTGANKLIIQMSASVVKSGGGNPALNMRIKIDGTPLRGAGGQLVTDPTSVSLMAETAVLTAGAHTVLLEWKVSTGTAEINPVTMPDSEHCSLYVQEVSV